MKTIVQKVMFRTTPKGLYDIFLDSKKHTEATGGKATASNKVGGSFKAWDGYHWGKNLALVPGRRIVQTWRNLDFKKGEPDSILLLDFQKKGKGSELTMVHAMLPDRMGDLAQGWRDYYWKPMAKYLKKKAK
jgi:activator of HSP90 ATPase